LKKDIIVITGPTTVGKTRIAVQLALELDGEIISADSRQVYRKMDIGTGKDLEIYNQGARSIPYHLIDICEPGEQYHLRAFQRDFQYVHQDVKARGKVPLVCGGTGLYIEAILRDYRFTAVPVDEQLRVDAMRMSTNQLQTWLEEENTSNIPFDVSTRKRIIRALEICRYAHLWSQQDEEHDIKEHVIFCLYMDRKRILQNIQERLEARMEQGMVDEVRVLLEEGVSMEKLKYYGLEYKFVSMYIEGTLDYDTMLQRLNVAIRQYAKRQMTWFRKMERQGLQFRWINVENSTHTIIQEMKACL